MYRTLIVLTIAQSFAQTGAPIVVLLAGIVGGRLAPDPSFATLPVACMIVGTAMSTVPASFLMARIGRKLAFILAAVGASLGGLLAAWAISAEQFQVFCAATFLIGGHNAFVQQYRFAVSESVPLNRIGPAVSILMLAGVVAAFVGPEAAQRLQFFGGFAEFVGSFLGLSVLMLVTAFCLLFYPGGDVVIRAPADAARRSLGQIVSNPLFLLATGGAVVGYVVMSLVMTATPVSMHTIDHHSLEDTSWVIQSHIMAMFLPSLVTGLIIAKIGARSVIGIGLVVLLVSLGIAAIDRQLMHYWWSLVLLGVGWNFLFVGGTTLLPETFQPEERFKVQALNDFLVFGLQAIAALGSGVILAIGGWHWILIGSVPWLLVLLVVLFINRRA